MIKHITLLWFVASIASLTVYAFTGSGAWVQLDPKSDGFIRFMLLMFFHLGGVMAYPMAKNLEGLK